MDLNEIFKHINEETKTPEQIETEHKDTALWFARKIISEISPNDLDSLGSDSEYDRIQRESPDIFVDYYKKIVADHEKEFKNYYLWLVWMEDQMKKFETPEKFIESIKK